MLLGARQFFERRGAPAWQNPYVTDGLVAMWDGEWNAGGGVHDPNATTWKNIVGTSGDLSVVGYSDGWKVNHFSLSGSNTHYASGNVPFRPSDSVTYEFCCNVHNTETSGRFWGWNLPNGNVNYSSVGLTTYDSTRHYRYRGMGIATTGYTLGRINPSTNALTTSALTISGSSVCAYLQGDVVLNETGSYSSEAGDIFAIGGGSDGLYGVVADVYCLRVYSRVLTAEEVAANYAIDKERFNLP